MSYEDYKKDDIHFMGSSKTDGTWGFDSPPCLPIPTVEALKLIKQEGVDKISAKLNEMHEWKKILYGNNGTDEQLNFSSVLEFADFKNRAILAVEGITAGNMLEKYPKLDLVLSEDYKKDNYELLRETDYYLIRVKEVLDNTEFANYITDFYPL